MPDREECLLALLVDDRCEFGVLVLYLLDDLFLDAFLLLHGRLHRLALLECRVRLIQQLFELANLQGTRLFEGHSAPAPTVVIEVAIVAEGLVVDATVGRQRVLVLTHADFGLGDLGSGLWVSLGLLRRGSHWLCGWCSFNHTFSSLFVLLDYSRFIII